MINKYDLVGLIPKDKGSGGGAWLGTFRLFSGLNKLLGKNKIKLYVAIKNSKEDFINTIYPFGISKFSYLIMSLISRIINNLILKNKNRGHFSFNFIPSLLDLKLFFFYKKGKNIYLHWVGNNFASIWLIYIISLKKNLIIKFADYWWLTGGCHYPDNCNGFIENACVDCPKVKKIFRWLPKLLFKIKRKILNKNNVNIVSPSKHLYESSKNLINNEKVFYIKNGLDIYDYKKRDYSKSSLGIIAHGYDDQRKNHNQIKDIVNLLIKHSDITINFCGNSTKRILPFDYKKQFPNINNFGFIKEEIKINKFYYQSNHILFLSKQDNSPNQIMEAMSNGSIIIAFDNFFTREHIIHNHNGFLVPNNLSTHELYLRIIDIFKDFNNKKISLNAYKYAKSNFSSKNMTYKYSRLLEKKI